VARTAVVAGTATAVSNRVSRRQAGRWAAQDQQPYDAQADQQQQANAQPPPQNAQPPAGGDEMDNTLDQLRQLADLKAQGVLSDAEFEAQKARILGQ
jgi:putative oligomerization/nucleic acid binding protein